MKVLKNMVLSVKWLCLVSKLTSCHFCGILHWRVCIDNWQLSLTACSITSFAFDTEAH